MKNISKELLFGDALDEIDIGGLNLGLITNLNDLIEDNDNNNRNVNNDNNNSNNNNRNNDNNINENSLLDNDSENNEKYDENDLGVDIICSDENGKIFKLTDLNIPLYENKKESTENYLRKLMERVKKDKNEKEEKEDIKKRERNEKEEIYKLMKRSKKNQKYSKINVAYDEKFFDKTLFIKNNNEIKDNDRKNSLLEEQKNKQEIKKENYNKIKENYNYDDLIKNSLFQFGKYYNNNCFNKNEEIKEKEEIEETRMKIEDDLTNDFKNKIYLKLANENINNEIIKKQSELFLGETSFLNFH